MNKQLLTVCIVNYNSADFVINTLKCLTKLTFAPYQVLIVDNSSPEADFVKLKEHVEGYDNVKLTRKDTRLTGSMAHGTALNELVAQVRTPYFSILDADATWLLKDWDQVLISQIGEMFKVIGTQADGLSKPQDFPLMYAALFETETFKKLKVDFRPADPSKQQDTGYDLREKYLAAGFRGKVLEMRNTREFKQGPFAHLIGVGEYYLGDRLVASHFGRGSTLGANKYMCGINRYLYKLPGLGDCLLQRRGQQEKQLWINICRELTDQQMQ